jgi:folate-binding protein YgfZ
MKMHAISLSEHGFLRVQGPDADGFLQGQLSSDLRKLTPAQGQISSYSTAKGRALALPHLFRNADGSVLMELPAGLVEPTLKRLRLFVLRAKVTLEAPGAHLQALGLIGDDAPQWLAAQTLPIPEGALATAARDGLLVVRRFGDLPRYSLIGTPEALQPLREALPAGAPDEGSARWRQADIEAGVPVVYPETRELFIPQMLNLDLLGGIGFDKGCYTGQEIVARLHYLGQVKRRMWSARVEGAAPAPGSAVVTADGQAAGEIVDAVDGVDGHALTSVVIQLNHRVAPLHLKDGGARMMLLTGPEH